MVSEDGEVADGPFESITIPSRTLANMYVYPMVATVPKDLLQVLARMQAKWGHK